MPAEMAQPCLQYLLEGKTGGPLVGVLCNSNERVGVKYFAQGLTYTSIQQPLEMRVVVEVVLICLLRLSMNLLSPVAPASFLTAMAAGGGCHPSTFPPVCSSSSSKQ